MLKYQYLIAAIENCPSSNSLPIERKAFRFVFDCMGGNSFIPIAVQQPKRTYRSVYEKCSSCGLSMFTTEKLAKDRFNDLSKRNKNIHKSIGDKLALVSISPQLGVSSKIGPNGHFDFFEYDGCELKTYSSVVGGLL